MGQSESEISGPIKKVMKTIEELPKLMETVSNAFGSTKNGEEMNSVSSFFLSESS
jgi:hypothetical protein